MNITLIISIFLASFTLFAEQLAVSCVGDYRNECSSKRKMADGHVARYNKAKREYQKLRVICARGCGGGLRAKKNAYAQMLKGYQSYVFPSYNFSTRKNKIQNKLRTYRKNKAYLRDGDNLPLLDRPSREDKLFGTPVRPNIYENVR